MQILTQPVSTDEIFESSMIICLLFLYITTCQMHRLKQRH